MDALPLAVELSGVNISPSLKQKVRLNGLANSVTITPGKHSRFNASTHASNDQNATKSTISSQQLGKLSLIQSNYERVRSKQEKDLERWRRQLELEEERTRKQDEKR